GEDGGGRRGGKEKPGRVGAPRTNILFTGRDETAETSESLCERAFDDIDPTHGVVTLADAATARAIHADRVHFITKSHGAVAFCQIANRVYRRNVAVHGIETFENDQLWTRRIACLQQLLEMGEIVVPPDLLLAAGPSHPFDHGVMIERVGQKQTIRQ